MVRLSRIALLLIVYVGFGGCQSYTTGLQESAESGNEPSAIVTLRSIATAQASYAAANAGDYGTFQQLHDAGYLDSRFNSTTPEVSGYTFTMLTQKSEGEPPRFSCNADPARPGAWRHFYIDSTSTEIRVNPSQPATAVDGPIGQ
jgi:hypothetical protein